MREHDKCFRDIGDIVDDIQYCLDGARDVLRDLGAHLLKHGQYDPKVASLIPNIRGILLEVDNHLGEIHTPMWGGETTDG